MNEQAKHTPGPWRTETWHYDRNGGEHVPVVIAGDTALAMLECDGGNPPNPYTFSLAEAEANARLIAAAPETAAERDRLRELCGELVEALKAVAEGANVDDPELGPEDACDSGQFDDAFYMGMDQQRYNTAVIARAALARAKAEGVGK